MSLVWKIDVLQALKSSGYSTYKLRKDKIFGERVIQQLRVGDPVSWEVLSRLCDLLGCDIGDILTVAAFAPVQAAPPEGCSGGTGNGGGNPLE